VRDERELTETGPVHSPLTVSVEPFEAAFTACWRFPNTLGDDLPLVTVTWHGAVVSLPQSLQSSESSTNTQRPRWSH
jgi:hypothetical protein